MIRRMLHAAAFAIVLLAAIPLVLVPIYALPFVRPVSTLMLAEHFSFQPFEREWTPLEKIAPVLVRSVMMSEDGQYCFHGGVDWTAMRSVVDQAIGDGEASRGASTIPMQTVKNLFLWNGRSYLRKGLELPLALYADLIWSKSRTMELYLNIAEWGNGIYGIGAASRYYFNKPASELSARQAALLAVALPSPLTRDPPIHRPDCAGWPAPSRRGRARRATISAASTGCEPRFRQPPLCKPGRVCYATLDSRQCEGQDRSSSRVGRRSSVREGPGARCAAGSPQMNHLNGATLLREFAPAT